MADDPTAAQQQYVDPQNIPTGADLNSYTAFGWYLQPTNANAAAGSNYPQPLAGWLEVGANSTAMAWQRYTTYGNVATHSRVWRRQYYNGTWSAWMEADPALVGGVCNVKLHHGARGDGTTDDRAAIQAALNSTECRIVYFPPGVYRVNSTLLLGSNTIMRGAGRHNTIIRLNAATAGVNEEVVRTSNFTGSAHSSYVSQIGIEDLTIDGDGWNRGSPTSAIRGSALLLSTVTQAWVRNCRIMNGNRHNLDVAASTYQTAGAITRATGPSTRVVIENCEGVDQYFDDCFTMHDSGDSVIRDCTAVMNTNRLPLTNGHMNGFEIDDGCYRIKVENCRATGFARGFQVKGHEGNYPASDVVFERCLASGCSAGFQIYYAIADMYESAGSTSPPNHARSVYVRNCAVSGVTRVNGTDIDDKTYALSVVGYVGVSIDGLDILAGTYVDRCIYVHSCADHVSLENIVFKDIGVSLASNRALTRLGSRGRPFRSWIAVTRVDGLESGRFS